MFLLNLIILPFKIVIAIINFIVMFLYNNLIGPILDSSMRNGPKELFVWFCIIATAMYIFAYLAK